MDIYLESALKKGRRIEVAVVVVVEAEEEEDLMVGIEL